MDNIVVSIIRSNLGWFLLLFAALNSTLGNLLIKSAMNTSGNSEHLASIIFSKYFILGVFFYGLNLFCFTLALKYFDVSIAYPTLSGMGFVFLVFSAWMVFGENISMYKILGIGCLILGIFLVNYRN